ncbi:MAG: sigma-54 dependent transcriptional regulator, partial [Thermodesulfobacteriota bacterium]
QEVIHGLKDKALVTFFLDHNQFEEELFKNRHDLLLLHIDGTGKKKSALIEKIRLKYPYTPIIVTSRVEKVDFVVSVMNKGASDFLVPPITPVRIEVAVNKAMENRELRNEIAYLRHRQDVVYDFGRVIGFSPSMKKVLKSLEKFSRTDSTILITGATGTGKSFLSGTVHFNSPRKKRPFIKINCANIPEDLLESELFGHEKGAFTSADKQRIGRFEQASGGTLFLDEIGEISMGLQTKLLRVLEEKSFERVGGNKTIYADVRVIAATNKDLLEQIDRGLFREDLYYRINVLPVRLPSLQERPDCVMPLARTLLAKSAKSLRSNVNCFAPEVIASIREYDWPGNIRQLANAIERAVILEESDCIHLESLSLPGEERAMRPAASHQADSVATVSVAGSLEEQEKLLILQVLEECHWVQKVAADKLGVSPRALNYKVKKFAITHPQWRKNR